jgi:hypothetical protein
MSAQSAMPLTAVETDFAVDSTGFSTCRFVRCSKKWGRETDNREWVKLHAMTGVRTNIVTAAEGTGWTAADTNFFRPLLAASAENFAISEVSADKAYLSHANVGCGREVRRDAVHPVQEQHPRPDRRRWMGAHVPPVRLPARSIPCGSYHKRSNVETTFSMIKTKFGDSIMSKSDTGQMNEAL